MRSTAAALSLFLLAGTSSTALAAATPEEAERIAEALRAYLGSVPGVVTVVPAGESYTLTLDANPFIAMIPEPGVTGSMTPLVMTLTGQGGGKWKVDQDQSFSLTFKVEGAVDMALNLASIKGTGIFDESLGAFATSSGQMTQLTWKQTVVESGTTTNVAYAIGEMTTESTATAAANGVDAASNYTFKDLTETISVPAAPDGSMPPMDFVITAPSGTQEATAKGIRIKPMGELLAWFVANPSENLIVSKQAELKDKLRAALPLWDNVEAIATLDNLNVGTMLGNFGMEHADIAVSLNGAVADGYFREKFAFTGIKMPDGIVPPWAASLVPSSFTIDFNITGFNAEAPARLLIDSFDLSQDPPIKPEIEDQLLAAFMPAMAVTIGLGPSEILGPIYHLKAEGSMTAGPMSMPGGQATVQLKGIDEIMAALNGAPPEMGLEMAAPVGIMAKGMAKQEADGYLSWKIESTPAGGVLVNGTDVTKMGGQ